MAVENPQSPTSVRPVLLVLNTNADTVEMLRAVLHEAGFLTISSFVDDSERGTTTLAPLLRGHPPTAVIFDVAPP